MITGVITDVTAGEDGTHAKHRTRTTRQGTR